MREWAVKLEAKPKYVVSSTRKDFPWTNSHHIAGDLRAGVQKLKDATPAGVFLGSGKLATELDRLDLIDEYKFLVHPRIAGHGPTLYQSGLPARDSSSWSRRSRSAAARWPCTTGACADSEQPHRAQLAGQRVVGNLLAAQHGVPLRELPLEHDRLSGAGCRSSGMANQVQAPLAADFTGWATDGRHSLGQTRAA